MQIPMAKIEADKETYPQRGGTKGPSSNHYQRCGDQSPAFVDEKDELDSYLLYFECFTKNTKWEKNT